MEEKEKKTQELSYEQLKAYVIQMETQAKKIYQENINLRQALNSKDIEYAFRCLDHADMFSKEFITIVVNRLEELLNPGKEEENKEEEE